MRPVRVSQLIMLFAVVLFAAIAMVASGCASAPAGKPPFSIDQIRPMTDAAIAEFGHDLLRLKVPADAAEWCPKFASFSEIQRRKFFTELTFEMIRYESSFNPETKYTEDFNDRTGKPVISRGLLQISIESANSYGCGIKKAEELHDPQTNLACGIRILNRWVGRDQRIGGTVSGNHYGCGRYHSVCRKTSKSRPKIIAKVSQLPICK